MLPSSIVVVFNSGVRIFACKQENQKILDSGLEVNITTMEMMEDSESMVAQTKSLAYRTRPAPSFLKEEVMYTPKKDKSDPDMLLSVVPPKEPHFDENNTPQPMPYPSLGETKLRQHDPFSILESHDEAIEAFGSVIEQVVGFTTFLAQHNHGEVSQAFEHLPHHRQCVEKGRHRVRRLMESEENSQEFMGGFDNLLQNSILPSLKKHSAGLEEMFLLKKLTQCYMGALEGRVQRLMSIEHHHESLHQRVDQVQQGNDQNLALAQHMSDSMGTLKQQMELLSQSHANSQSGGDLFSTMSNSLSSRIDAMEAAFNNGVAQIQSSFSLAIANEISAVEQQLNSQLQLLQGSNDVSSLLQQLDMARMKICTLEERVDSLYSSPPASLISSRLERVEKPIHDITPKVASAHIWSRRIDSMENQLRDFKQECSAFQGIGNKVRELESHLRSIKHSLSQYDGMRLRMSKVEGEGASLNVRMGLLEKLPPPIPPTPHVSDVGG